MSIAIAATRLDQRWKGRAVMKENTLQRKSPIKDIHFYYPILGDFTLGPYNIIEPIAPPHAIYCQN